MSDSTSNSTFHWTKYLCRYHDPIRTANRTILRYLEDDALVEGAVNKRGMARNKLAYRNVDAGTSLNLERMLIDDYNLNIIRLERHLSIHSEFSCDRITGLSGNCACASD